MEKDNSRFHSIFEIIPIPIWEEDFSDVKTYLSELNLLGKEENFIREFLKEYPDQLKACVSKVKLLNLNIACLELHHATSKEQLLENFSSIFVKESFDTIIDQLVAICTGTNHFEVDSKTKTLNGVIKDIQLKWTVVPGYEETLKSVIITTNDISQRIRTRQQIEESEAKLLYAQRLAKIGNWELNIPNQELIWSDEVYRIWEVEKKEIDLSPTYFFSTIHPEDLERLNVKQENAIIGDIPLDSTQRIILKNGLIKWTNIKASIEYDANNLPIKLVGTVQDITEEESLKESLKELVKRYHFVTRATFDAVRDLDLKTNTIFWGEGFENIFGYDRNKFEHSKESWIKLIHANDQQRILESMEQATKGKSEIWQEEYLFKKANGRYSLVNDRAVIVRDSKGNVIRFVGAMHDITEQKKSEMELKARTQFIETALDNLPIGIAVNKMDSGEATLMNKQFSEIYGWPEKELRDVSSFFEKVYPNPTYRALISSQIIADIESGDPSRMEWKGIEITTKSGLKKIISAKNIPVYDQKIMISTVIDETKKIQAEKALQLSNERFLYATKAVSDAIWDWDIDAGTVFWGSGYESLFGYNSNQMYVSEDLWETKVHPEDKHEILESVEKARKNPTIDKWTGEYRFQKANGDYAYVLENTVILRDKSGKPTRMVGALQDMTERKQSEKALLNKTKYLETISNLVEALLLYNDWTNVLHKNLKMIGEAVGCDRTYFMINFIDSTTSELHTRQVYEWAKDGISPQIDNPNYQNIQLSHYPDFLNEVSRKSHFAILTSQTSGATKQILAEQDIKSTLQIPIFIKENFFGYIGLDDCTRERIWSNEEISFLQTIATNIGVAIEKADFEKSLKNLNDELRISNKNLELSNSELEQFAYVASHDLQEPLRMITSFLALIERKYQDKLDEKGKQYIHFASDGAKRMRDIILDLLEFSRVGRVGDLKKYPFQTEVVVREIESLLKGQIQSSKAVIIHSNLPEIHTQRAAFRQLVQNLISNAIKYQKPDNKPIIEISCQEKQSEWVFSIKDNGIGISPEYYEKIFVIFQRLHDKSSYSGSGIGLAICKKIIDFLGGKIWVESELDNGSIFYFTVPKNHKK